MSDPARPLHRVLGDEKLPPERAARIVLAAAHALAQAHRRGALHGDLKPASILLSAGDKVEIVDFGAVPLVDRPLPKPVTETNPTLAALEDLAASRATFRGQQVVFGALPYKSPEQLQGELPDARSDVYALGVVFYEMLTGQRPFAGASRSQLIEQILVAKPRPASSLTPGLPSYVDAVLARALALHRAERYASADELAAALEQATGIVRPPVAGRVPPIPAAPGFATEAAEGAAASPSVRPEPQAQRGSPNADPAPLDETSSEPLPPLAPAPARRRTAEELLESGRPRWVWPVAMAVLVVLFAVSYGAAMLYARRTQSATVDPRTILIAPMEVRGQQEEADYIGRAFAEALAVNLALGSDLKVLPVPRASELPSGASDAAAELAKKKHAGRLITGAVTRAGDRVTASLSLIDPLEGRLLWGTSLDARDGDLPGLAASLVRQLALQLGASFPKLYEYISNVVGSAAVAARPELAQALTSLRMGQIERALSASQTLIELFPNDADTRFLRAQALLLAWDADPSQAQMDALNEGLAQLDRVDPQNPYTTFYRGYLLQGEGRVKEAIQRYATVLVRKDLAPAARAWVLKYRAAAEQLVAEKTEALAHLKEALEMDPANAWTVAILAESLRESGEYDESVVRARQAVALMPSFWRAHQTLGLSLAAGGRHDEASRAFHTACEMTQAQAPCALEAIAVLRARGKAAAKPLAERAAKQNPTTWGVYNLACYWALAGETNEALRQLEHSLELGLGNHRIADDPDLASLRDLPAFKALVARAERRLRSP